MREPRAPKGMQDESRKPVSATFCRPPRNAVRLAPSPRVSLVMGMTCKRTNGICMRADSIRSGKKPSEALFFPPFCTRRDCLAAKKFRLCGRRFISLRKAILFLPQKNDRRDGEMLHTSSLSTRFLTVRFLFAAVRPAIETRKRKESLSFWQEIPCLGDNPTRALQLVPTEFRLSQDSRRRHRTAQIE